MKRLFNILFLLLLTLAPVGMVCAEESNIESEEFVTAADGTRYTQAQLDSLRQTDDFVKASLVVADPGEVLYSMLGHACLHLECPIFGLDYIFSYESESVSDKVFRFLMGDLKMGMFAIEKEEFLQSYKEEGRGVREYELYLSPERKTRLWQVLDGYVTEGADLQYDYFHKGCAKSVVMVLKEALGEQKICYATWPTKYEESTQRELVQDAITSAVKSGLLSECSGLWNAFLMYALIGSDGDRDYPCEEKLIVPNDLVEVWQQATVDGKLLLGKDATVLCDAQPQGYHPCWITPTLVATVLLILALIGWWTEWQWVSWLILLVVSAIGSLMTYLLLFSTLPCTSWSWLIIPFNILPLIGWYWRRYWALPYAIVLAIWLIGMIVWPHTIVEPSYLILTLAEIIMLSNHWWINLKLIILTKTKRKNEKIV